MREIFSESGLFMGYPSHVVPIHSIEALHSKKFYIIGKMIATCLVQTGIAPVCFAEVVADFLIFHTPKSDVNIDDIPDYSVQSKLKEVYLIIIYCTHACLCFHHS